MVHKLAKSEMFLRSKVNKRLFPITYGIFYNFKGAK